MTLLFSYLAVYVFFPSLPLQTLPALVSSVSRFTVAVHSTLFKPFHVARSSLFVVRSFNDPLLRFFFCFVLSLHIIWPARTLNFKNALDGVDHAQYTARTAQHSTAKLNSSMAARWPTLAAAELS